METNIFSGEKYAFNRRNTENGLKLLSSIRERSIKSAFFDPQYRGVLDRLKYGNEGKNRGQARCSLPQMDIATIKEFISQIDRVLLPSGYLFLWIDKFHLCQGISEWHKNTDFSIVDLIVWNKMRMGMGYRSRHVSEYLAILQKKPVKAGKSWNDHGIPDIWEERKTNIHPHAKPLELIKRLILAVSDENDIVLDPAAGSFNVLKACKELNRIFIGCDLLESDNGQGTI